jgi:hypothetical protein
MSDLQILLKEGLITKQQYDELSGKLKVAKMSQGVKEAKKTNKKIDKQIFEDQKKVIEIQDKKRKVDLDKVEARTAKGHQATVVLYERYNLDDQDGDHKYKTKTFNRIKYTQIYINQFTFIKQIPKQYEEVAVSRFRNTANFNELKSILFTNPSLEKDWKRLEISKRRVDAIYVMKVTPVKHQTTTAVGKKEDSWKPVKELVLYNELANSKYTSPFIRYKISPKAKKFG